MASKRRTSRFALTLLLPAFAAVSLLLPAGDALALALGRITVQSALGEALRAEIDILDINPDEAASLRASIGAPEVFQRAGVDYNPAAASVQVSLQRRADGRSYLRLSGDRVVNDPFLDLIIEANWSAGRLVRDYTLLIDPPAIRQAPPAPSVPLITQRTPEASPAESSAAARPAPLPQGTVLPEPSAPAATAAQRSAQRTAPGAASAVAAAPKAEIAPARAPTKAPATAAANSSPQVAVRAGDTASKIAASVKPPTVSLDQMLVALLRSNPDAFGDGNVNRLKAGAVLEVPSADAARATPAAEATRIVAVQSRDFNDYRRGLATGALATGPRDTDKRASGGKVQAMIEDKKPGAASPDKLSLQKAEIAGKLNQEALAKDLQAKAAAQRVAELNKNISDLGKLAAPQTGASAIVGSPASAAKTTASAPAITLAAPAKTPEPAAVAASAQAPAASSPASASVPVVSVPATASVPAAVTAFAPASAAAPGPSLPASAASAPAASGTAVGETSLVMELLDNPLVPAAAGTLVALLAGLAVYRVRQRKKSGQVDSSFMESRLQPDSFFGASGGQKIDTNEAAPIGSSMMYSPSQLDAGADVDPVAEADVYLAYGRDLQAEEILKEAVRVTPDRAAIHFKLLQIYAKRRDVAAYASTALDASRLSGGAGSEWRDACVAGREIDPTNPLYSDGVVSVFGGETGETVSLSSPAESAFLNTDLFSATQEPIAPIGSVDLDLDLDFSDAEAGETVGGEGREPSASTLFGAIEPELTPVVPMAATELDLPALDLDAFETTPPGDVQTIELGSDSQDLADTRDRDEAANSEVTGDAGRHDGNAMEFSISEFPESPAPAVQAAPERNSTADAGMLNFDLDPVATPGDLALEGSEPMDLDFADDSTAAIEGDPLETKLALAEEFQAIGDDDGARTLAQEVADEATGVLQAKAKRFLAELG